MSSLTIRAFKSDDVPAMIDLFRQSVRRIASQDYNADQCAAWAPDIIAPEQWEAHYSNLSTWLVEREAMLAGYTALAPDGHIDVLYTHPDHQRRGVGRALLDHIEHVAKNAHITRLYSEVSLTARPLFERCGFNVIAPQTVRYNGQDFTNFRMEKGLSVRS